MILTMHWSSIFEWEISVVLSLHLGEFRWKIKAYTIQQKIITKFTGSNGYGIVNKWLQPTRAKLKISNR